MATSSEATESHSKDDKTWFKLGFSKDEEIHTEVLTGKNKEREVNTQKNNILFFKLKYIVDIQYYICFKCTTQGVDIYIHYKLITIRLATICHHTKLTDCIFHAARYILVTYLF